MRYPIILHTDDERQFGVTVPDLTGCFSQGDTVENAVENAREAILFHAAEMLSANQPIPQPSEFVDLAEFHGASGKVLIAFADVDLESITGPSRRINITIREASLQIIDIRARARGMNRSQYLAYAGTHFESQE
jgi:predicted RNase H-like HicB family nuclease